MYNTSFQNNILWNWVGFIETASLYQCVSHSEWGKKMLENHIAFCKVSIPSAWLISSLYEGSHRQTRTPVASSSCCCFLVLRSCAAISNSNCISSCFLHTALKQTQPIGQTSHCTICQSRTQTHTQRENRLQMSYTTKTLAVFFWQKYVVGICLSYNTERITEKPNCKSASTTNAQRRASVLVRDFITQLWMDSSSFKVHPYAPKMRW